jgi:hypothetical protein
MRKEDDSADIESKPTSGDKSARKTPRVVDVDEELEDKSLLGESTLAKLNASKEDVVAVETPKIAETPKTPETSETQE